MEPAIGFITFTTASKRLRVKVQICRILFGPLCVDNFFLKNSSIGDQLSPRELIWKIPLSIVGVRWSPDSQFRKNCTLHRTECYCSKHICVKLVEFCCGRIHVKITICICCSNKSLLINLFFTLRMHFKLFALLKALF